MVDLIQGAEKMSRSMVEEEREIVAYHESGHALIGWLLEHTDALLRVFFYWLIRSSSRFLNLHDSLMFPSIIIIFIHFPLCNIFGLHDQINIHVVDASMHL